MRPQIPDALEEAIEETYEEAGYATETELVRDAIRQHVNRLQTGKFGVSKAFSVRGDAYADGAVHLGENHHANYQPVNANFVTDGTAVNGLVFGMIGAGGVAGLQYFTHRALAAHDDLRVVVVEPLNDFDDYVDNIQSSQTITVDTTTPLGLFNPVTDEHNDARFYAQAIQAIHEGNTDEIPSEQQLTPIVEPMVSNTEDAVDAFVEPFQSGDSTVGLSDDEAIRGMAGVRPFVTGQYKRLQRDTRFDISDARVTYLKTRERTTVAGMLAAYRQARRVDDPVLIVVNEIHATLGSDDPAYTALLSDAEETNVGLFGSTKDINAISPRTLRTIFKQADHTFGFRTNTIEDEHAFQLNIGNREREYFSSLLSGKNDVIRGIEALYRGKAGEEWCPLLIRPSDEEIGIIFEDEAAGY